MDCRHSEFTSFSHPKSTAPQAGTRSGREMELDTPTVRLAIINAMLARVVRPSILLDAVERGVLA
ncbi:MAG: hypothetical protein P8L85_23850 [Rubripirellula sp.]|nr:hypothetical protein [Rubripirellula sp.]